MKLIACLLVLLTGCNTCYIQPTETTPPASSHDVVAMDAIPTPAPTVAPTVDAEPVPPPKVAARRILIVGDSEACAVASQVKDAKLPTDTVDVDCKGGTVVQYWAAGGQRHPRPDTVLIFLGTNHYWNQKDTPDVKPILDLVKEQGFSCVWVGNTAVKGRHWNINNLLREAVTPTCSYFDTEAADIPLWDGVHPGPAAALKWLNAVWPMIPMKYEEAHE